MGPLARKITERNFDAPVQSFRAKRYSLPIRVTRYFQRHCDKPNIECSTFLFAAKSPSEHHEQRGYTSPFKVIFHPFRSLAVETCGRFGSRLCETLYRLLVFKIRPHRMRCKLRSTIRQGSKHPPTRQHFRFSHTLGRKASIAHSSQSGFLFLG